MLRKAFTMIGWVIFALTGVLAHAHDEDCEKTLRAPPALEVLNAQNLLTEILLTHSKPSFTEEKARKAAVELGADAVFRRHLIEFFDGRPPSPRAAYREQSSLQGIDWSGLFSKQGKNAKGELSERYKKFDFTLPAVGPVYPFEFVTPSEFTSVREAPPAVQAATPNLLRIKATGENGAATITVVSLRSSSDRIFLTNQHVVDYLTKVTGVNASEFKAEVVTVDQKTYPVVVRLKKAGAPPSEEVDDDEERWHENETDMAVLELEGLPASVAPGITQIRDPELGEASYLVGYPVSRSALVRVSNLGVGEPDLSKGQVIEVRGAGFRTSNLSVMGCSGSPLLGEDGAFLGFVWGGSEGVHREVGRRIPLTIQLAHKFGNLRVPLESAYAIRASWIANFASFSF